MATLTFDDDRPPLQLLISSTISQTDYSYLCEIADRKHCSVDKAAVFLLQLGLGLSRYIDDL